MFGPSGCAREKVGGVDGIGFARILFFVKLKEHPVCGELASMACDRYTNCFAVLTLVLSALLSSL